MRRSSMAKVLDPGSTYGPFMIVLAISWAFWGVLVAQVCIYYNEWAFISPRSSSKDSHVDLSYAEDSKTMKSVVSPRVFTETDRSLSMRKVAFVWYDKLSP